MSTVKTSKELAAAIKNGQSTIEIEGDLVNKVIRLKATGAVAWAIAIGAIGIAVAAVAVTVGSAGTAAPASVSALFATAPAAAIALGGAEVATMAISVAVAAGGVGVLSGLYSDYRITNKSAGRLVLVKK